MTTLNFVGAAFVGLGGVVGYVKTQSLPSLVGKISFSFLPLSSSPILLSLLQKLLKFYNLIHP
jgi:uncharacterized membrane protein (UPF0136 family)